MSVARTVTEVIRQHVTLEVESIDRLYLNVYQSRLQVQFRVLYRAENDLSPQASWAGTPIQLLRRMVAQANDLSHYVPLLEFKHHSILRSAAP
jgi:hypothetical protein